MYTKFEKENEEKTLELVLERTTSEQNKMRKFLKTPVVFSDPSLFSPERYLEVQISFVSGYSCPTTFRKIPAFSLEKKAVSGSAAIMSTAREMTYFTKTWRS